MTTNRWGKAHQAAEDFRKDLSESFPELTIIPAYDSKWTEEDWNQRKPKGFSSKLRGIYMLYSEEEDLQYVGVASTNFSKRVWSHDDWLKYRYIDIIPFEERYFHFALALEYYLISKLKPKQNTAFIQHKSTDS